MLPELLTMIVIVILVYKLTYWFHLPFYRYVILLHIDTCLDKFQRLIKNYIYKQKFAYEDYTMY